MINSDERLAFADIRNDGAMGIREARRLRGESGRAIFFEEIDKDTFGKLF